MVGFCIILLVWISCLKVGGYENVLNRECCLCLQDDFELKTTYKSREGELLKDNVIFEGESKNYSDFIDQFNKEISDIDDEISEIGNQYDIE